MGRKGDLPYTPAFERNKYCVTVNVFLTKCSLQKMQHAFSEKVIESLHDHLLPEGWPCAEFDYTVAAIKLIDSLWWVILKESNTVSAYICMLIKVNLTYFFGCSYAKRPDSWAYYYVPQIDSSG